MCERMLYPTLHALCIIIKNCLVFQFRKMSVEYLHFFFNGSVRFITKYFEV